MAVNPDTVEAGDVLYDCHRHKMGNTTASTMGCWQVRVLEVDAEHKTFKVSWNTNAATTYYRAQIAKLRRSPATKKVAGRQWGFTGVAKCMICGTEENLTKCLGCGRILCKDHKSEERCTQKKKRTSQP
jgi:hypothetical protein